MTMVGGYVGEPVNVEPEAVSEVGARSSALAGALSARPALIGLDAALDGLSGTATASALAAVSSAFDTAVRAVAGDLAAFAVAALVCSTVYPEVDEESAHHLRGAGW